MMRLTRPVFFMAIAVAMVSSLATQAHAQLRLESSILECEQFNTAIAAAGNAIVVSGIQAEETMKEEPAQSTFRPTQTIPFNSTVSAFTLPTGTLTAENSDGTIVTAAGRELFALQQFANDFNNDFIEFLTNPRTYDDSDGTSLWVLTPDQNLGTPIGFCFTRNNALGGGTRIFDGDTLIGEIDDPMSSFMAAPGQTITRIVFPNAAIFDIQVAFEIDVVEEEVSNQECLAGIAAEIGDLADAATDSYDAYALNLACYALSFSAKDKFYEEDGNRLSRRGGNVFTGAAYAICYLEHTGVEGTEDIVDRILEKLDQIVDDEIDYAIANGGHSSFIEAAEDYAELAEYIDEDLDNPVVATIAYKLAWAHAYFATY